MTFSSPFLLWALGLLTIPVIIHLFEFRRFKKVFFPDISLLKEVQSKSKTKNEIRHLIVLLSRMLFIAFLVLAFAEPIIIIDQDKGDSNDISVFIYIDNSLSMQSRLDGFDLLTQAKQDAFEIIESYPNETRFQLVTNDFHSSQRLFIDKETFTSRIDDIDLSPQVRKVSDVLDFHPRSQGQEITNSTFYLLSDFIGNLDSLPINDDTNSVVRFIKYGQEEVPNVSIDSLWHNSPIIQVNSETELMVRIKNHSSFPILDLPVNLYLNGKTSSAALVNIEPNSYIDTLFTIIPDQSGYLQGMISIDDSPLSFDDKFYFTLNISGALDIVEISEINEESPFERLFDSPEYSFKRMNSNQIRYDSLDNLDFLILNSISNYRSGLIAKMSDLAASGKTILITLPKSFDTGAKSSLADWLSISINDWDSSSLDVNRIEMNDRLFMNVFDNQPSNMNYPSVKGHWPIAGSNSKTLLQLFNGDPILSSIRFNESSIFVLSTPLLDVNTNLHKHALFVPSIINMPGYNGISNSPYYIIGTQKLKMTNPKSERIEILSRQDGSVFRPGRAHDGLMLNNQINQPGYYRIQTDSSLHQLISFNYSKSESQTSAMNVQEIQSMFQLMGLSATAIDSESDDLAAEVYTAEFGFELWPIFLLAALTTFILETILIKLFK